MSAKPTLESGVRHTASAPSPSPIPARVIDNQRLSSLAAGNARALLLITVAQRALSLLSIALLPRLLPLSDIGAMGSALALSAILGVISDLGLQAATVRSLSVAAETQTNPGPVVAAALMLRTCLGVAGCAVGGVLLVLGPFSTVVRLGGIIALAGLIPPYWSVYGGVLQAHFVVRHLRTVTLVNTALGVVAMLLAAALHTGALGVILSQTLVTVAFGFVVRAMGRRYQRPILATSRRHIRELAGTGWKLAVSSLCATLYYRLDTLILTAWSTATQVALYYSAYRLTEAFALFPGALVSALFPAITRLQVSDTVRALVLSTRMLRVLIAGGLAIALAGVLNAQLAVHLIYGHRYHSAVPLVQILSLAVPFMYFNLGLYQTAVAWNRTRLLLWATVTGAALNAAANVLLIPHLAAGGAAITTVLTEVVVTAPALPWWFHTSGLHLRPAALRSLAATAILAASFPVANLLGPVLCLLFTGPMIVLLLSSSGTMDRDLLAAVWRHRPRVIRGRRG